MTIITGYVIDVVRSSTYASNVGYTYISGATVYVGTSSTTTSSNGYFVISGGETSTVVVKYPRYEDTEVNTSAATWINMWKNKGYS